MSQEQFLIINQVFSDKERITIYKGKVSLEHKQIIRKQLTHMSTMPNPPPAIIIHPSEDCTVILDMTKHQNYTFYYNEYTPKDYNNADSD